MRKVWVAALLGSLLAGIGLPAGAACAQSVTVPVPAVALPAAVDSPAQYVGQTVCNPVDTPGVTALKELLLVTYGQAVIGGSRACTGSVSEHYDGRALDWMRSVRNPDQAAQVESFLAFLLAPGVDGTPQEMARRMGIMYLIWNNRMIRTYDPGRGWTEYKGCLSAEKSSVGLDTGCHRDHLHISLSWDGASQRTSWWTGAALQGGAGATGSSTGSLPGTGTGATPGTPYSAAKPVAVVIPRSVPRRPRSVTTKLRRGAVVVTWQAPKGASGAQVSGYLVAARAGSRSGPVAGTCTATTSARICWLPGLPSGVRYWVAVSATNLLGPSSAALRPVRVP